MPTGLAETVIGLEERLRASPLHKMHANYLIGAQKPDPTIANFLFRNSSDLERARKLEMDYWTRLISLEQFRERFPNVLFIAVNVHYDVGGFDVVDTFLSSGVVLVRPNLEVFINEASIELCRGADVVYIPDDKKMRGDVVVGVTIASTGGVAYVYKTDYEAPFSFRRGTSAVEVFERMELFVRTNGKKF